MNKKEWQGKSGGGKVGQKGLLLLFRYCPVQVGYAVLVFVVPFYMLFAAKGRHAAYTYFRQRHGYGPLRALGATYRNHYLFGQAFLDKFALFAGRKKSSFKYRVDGQEYLDRALESPDGILFTSSHVGNYEILGYLIDVTRRPVNSLIFGGEAPVMQKKRHAVLQSNRIRLIPIRPDMSHLFEVNRAASAGEIISIYSDRTFTGSRAIELDFLGAPAPFAAGAFHIAQKYRLNALSIHVVKHRAATYQVVIRPIEGTSVEELAASYVRSVERVVKEYPHQWFNYYRFWK